jgi:adenosylcobinamide-GDP ribazoletransferase
MVRELLVAVQFLTRIPLPSSHIEPDEYRHRLQRSITYFPLVGLLIGLATCLVMQVGLRFCSALTAALLALAFEAWVTGAFHEDAWADSIDALGGGWTKEQILAILKDSRHGTYGVISLVLGVGLRASLLISIPPDQLWFVLPWSACMGRWSILVMMSLLPPIADRPTMSRDVGGQASFSQLFLSLGLVTVVIGFAALMSGAMSPFLDLWWRGIIVSLAATGWWIWMIHRRVGGTTGDFLGANCFFVQLAVLLISQGK